MCNIYISIAGWFYSLLYVYSVYLYQHHTKYQGVRASHSDHFTGDHIGPSTLQYPRLTPFLVFTLSELMQVVQL